jgi:hypothetical protein
VMILADGLIVQWVAVSVSWLARPAAQAARPRLVHRRSPTRGLTDHSVMISSGEDPARHCLVEPSQGVRAMMLDSRARHPRRPHG